MKLALFADIHGNSIALDSVLHDIQQQGGVDGYWVLGDLVAQGFDPAGVMQRLCALPNARFVRGNTDRYTVTGDRRFPAIHAAQTNPDLVPMLVQVAQGFAWTHGALSVTGWFERLAALPLEQRLTLPDGTRLLGVHAAPGRDDGDGLKRNMSADELRAFVRGSAADLICVAHTHRQEERRSGDVHIVNVGSVSNPIPDGPDGRACYALLVADATGYDLSLRRVPYDIEAVIHAIQASHFFPNPEWLIEKFTPWRSAKV